MEEKRRFMELCEILSFCVRMVIFESIFLLLIFQPLAAAFLRVYIGEIRVRKRGWVLSKKRVKLVVWFMIF
jgi:hypothetical protein